MTPPVSNGLDLRQIGGRLYVGTPGTGAIFRLVGEPPRFEKIFDSRVALDVQWLGAETAGIAYFTATDEDHGNELWRTDGTREGTVRVTDIAPGLDDSRILAAVPMRGELFFAADDGVHGMELWAVSLGCVPSPETLCLDDGRFQVRARWHDTATAGRGPARASPLNEVSGAFWFFDSDNLELVIKVLDARSFNGHFWVFYASLSNVEFDLEVLDTVTGRVRTYHNSQGTFASVGDTTAFPAF